MAIVTRLGKGSKLTIEEMDNNLLSLESGVSDNVSSITSKLDKGDYTGTAKDLENAITAAVTASFHSTISKCVFKEWYGSSCVSEDMRQRQLLLW